MKKYIIALDQGTTSSRAMVFDHEGNIIASAQKELTQIYPRPGYVEQDPLEIYASQSGVLAEVMAKGDLSPDEIAGIGISGLRERAEKGEILFGTVDSWLIWKMTGGAVHITDYTNASRTMLYNIRTLCWDQHILDILDIPACMLPEVRNSSEIYGTVNLSGVPVPIAGVAGDQQADLLR